MAMGDSRPIRFLGSRCTDVAATRIRYLDEIRPGDEPYYDATHYGAGVLLGRYAYGDLKEAVWAGFYAPEMG